MASKQGDNATAAKMALQAAAVQATVTKELWNASVGMFMASNGVASESIDIWGNAMAGAIGFATEAQSKAIFSFFKRRESDIFYEGQVREIPKPQQWAATRWQTEWNETVGGDKDGTDGRLYQNGGYWATPHHHVLPFLAMHDKQMACRLLNDTISSFRGHGIWEWIGPFFPADTTGAPGYTASAADTYFASEHLRCWE